MKNPKPIIRQGLGKYVFWVCGEKRLEGIKPVGRLELIREESAPCLQSYNIKADYFYVSKTERLGETSIKNTIYFFDAKEGCFSRIFKYLFQKGK